MILGRYIFKYGGKHSSVVCLPALHTASDRLHTFKYLNVPGAKPLFTFVRRMVHLSERESRPYPRVVATAQPRNQRGSTRAVVSGLQQSHQYQNPTHANEIENPDLQWPPISETNLLSFWTALKYGLKNLQSRPFLRTGRCHVLSYPRLTVCHRDQRDWA